MERSHHPLTRKLFKIIDEKKTNLCIAADGMTIEKTLSLIEKVGPHICMLKTHSLHFGNKRPHKEYMQLLYESKKKFNFLLFEDAKFSDSFETIRLDYESYFASYVDLVTVLSLHDDFFKAIAKGAKNAQVPEDEPRGCLAVCEFSFAPNALDSEKCLEIAKRNPEICIGVICQKLPNLPKNMIKAVPGVHLESKTDGKGQQWRTPEEIKKDGVDVFIVGRGITSAPEHQWESLAIKYKELCYN